MPKSPEGGVSPQQPEEKTEREISREEVKKEWYYPTPSTSITYARELKNGKLQFQTQQGEWVDWPGTEEEMTKVLKGHASAEIAEFNAKRWLSGARPLEVEPFVRKMADEIIESINQTLISHSNKMLNGREQQIIWEAITRTIATRNEQD